MKTLIGILSIITGLVIGGILLPKQAYHSSASFNNRELNISFVPGPIFYIPSILSVVIGSSIGLLLIASAKKEKGKED